MFISKQIGLGTNFQVQFKIKEVESQQETLITRSELSPPGLPGAGHELYGDAAPGEAEAVLQGPCGGHGYLQPGEVLSMVTIITMCRPVLQYPRLNNRSHPHTGAVANLDVVPSTWHKPQITKLN